MPDQHTPPRRLLIIDARPDDVDALVPDIAALLARAGCPVRRVIADGPGGVAELPGPAGPAAGSPVGAAVGSPVGAGVGAGVAVAVGELVVLPEARLARRQGHDLALTRIEFDLLVELLRHANRVVTKDTLLSSVWHHEPVTVNAIEARVSRLRAKLEEHGPRLIHTVRGVGYVLHALPDRGGPATVIELVAVAPAGSPGAADPAGLRASPA